jgi:hypothetical protein
LASEQARTNGYLMDLDHPIVGKMTVTGCPVALNAEISREAKAVAEHGQHTEEILLEAGYSWEEIGNLRDAEVICMRWFKRIAEASSDLSEKAPAIFHQSTGKALSPLAVCARPS